MIENGYKSLSIIIEVKQNSEGYEDEWNEQREEKPSLAWIIPSRERRNRRQYIRSRERMVAPHLRRTACDRTEGKPCQGG